MRQGQQRSWLYPIASRSSRSGTTFIDLIMSLGIIAVLFGGVYLVYFSIETAVANIDVRSAATTAITNEIEMIRNLPYGSVGTVGGIPAGVIPQTQTVTTNNFSFVLDTTVLNIEDPFDTSPSSTPVADYKLVDITASCTLCSNFVPVEITTTVAPSILAQGTSYGSIFIYAQDANGLPVSGASIQVVNASVTPTIDLTDTTNASGVLKLIGVPTSTQGYQIFASESGYSSDQTYPVGGVGNPNPIEPNITVATATVSKVTFSIDKVSSLTVSATDDRCHAVPDEPFSIEGSKIIGTDPTILKFSTSSQMGSGGTITFPSMEWDTYMLALNDVSEDVAGTIPLDPITINPNTTSSFQFILQPAANPSLLVTVVDATTGAGISNANVELSKSGFAETLLTDQATLSETNWSSGQYTSESGIDASATGTLSLFPTPSSTYATGTVNWLVSDTLDLGSASATPDAISWNPASQPANTSLEFQIAVNNDDATWNFVGPDGTSNTYFTASSGIPASFSGNRYLRYEVFMSTEDPFSTPTLNGVTISFTGPCVPPAQAFFSSLVPGTYSAVVTAANYNEATSTVVVGSGYQSTTISMSEL